MDNSTELEAERAFHNLLMDKYEDLKDFESIRVSFFPHRFYRRESIQTVMLLVASIASGIGSLSTLTLGPSVGAALISIVLIIFMLMALFLAIVPSMIFENYKPHKIKLSYKSYWKRFALEDRFEKNLSLRQISKLAPKKSLMDILKPFDIEADKCRERNLLATKADKDSDKILYQALAYQELKLEAAEELVKKNEAAMEVALALGVT